MLLDGPHLLEEALDCGVAVSIAAFADGALEQRLAPLADRVARAGVRPVAADDVVFKALSPAQTPSGVVAIASRPKADLEAVLERAPQLLVLLDGVQDPGNVGAVIRAAEAFGSSGVIVSAGSADPFGWKALRGAMGSSLRLPVVTRAPTDDALQVLRSSGIRILVAVPRRGLPPSHIDLRKPSAILLGSEGAGISESLVAPTDERLTIPMQQPVESLNVAVAAALVLYEASRQRADVTVR